MVHYEQQYYNALKATLKEDIRVMGRGDVPVIKLRKPVSFEINLMKEGLCAVINIQISLAASFCLDDVKVK